MNFVVFIILASSIYTGFSVNSWYTALGTSTLPYNFPVIPDVLLLAAKV